MRKAIAICGRGGSGKSSTIRMVRDLLIAKYPTAKVNNLNPRLRVNTAISMTIGSRKIGITSQDDLGRSLRRTLQEFVSIGCKVIVCPIRRNGETFKAFKKLAISYDLLLLIRPPVLRRSQYQSSNRSDAIALVKDIEEALKA